MGTVAHSPLKRRGTAPRRTPEVPNPPQASVRRRVVADTAMARRNLVGPLLIAGEEGRPLSGAIRLAEALARRDGVNAHVVSVVQPLSSPLSHLVCQVADLEHQRAGGVQATDTAGPRSTAGSRDRRSLHLLQYRRGIWRTYVDHRGHRPATGSGVHLGGSPGAELARQGETEDAAFRLAKTAGVPVLAVPAHVDRLPRSALVNMDLGEASVRAARAALPLLAAGGSLDARPRRAGGGVRASRCRRLGGGGRTGRGRHAPSTW